VPKITAENIYDALYDEDEARVCKDISEEACTHIPANFFLNAVVMSVAKLADAVANTKTTLPWLLASVGVPGWMIAVLVPIRESGSMLPQLAIGGWVRSFRVRKWWYVLGSISQALMLLGMVLSILFLDGVVAGWAVLVLVVLMSLSRGFCSVASKDVIGKTVPKTRRGRVTGLSATVAGLGTLIVVVLLSELSRGTTNYLILILVAVVCWVIAAFLMSRVVEEPGAVEGGVNGLQEALSKITLIAEDTAFRRFVFARALLMGTGLAAPFVVVLAQSHSATSLTFFLVAQGLASLTSGYVWGVVADHSSRKLLMAMAVTVGALGSFVFVVDLLWQTSTTNVWFYPMVYFVLALVHDGVRMGRKTYLLDLSGGDKRTDYVAVSNTIIGALLLLAGVLTSALQVYGNTTVILVLSLFAFASLGFLSAMPEAQQDP
jgi:MFS family permease